MSYISIIHVRILCSSLMSQILRFWAINIRNFHYRPSLIISLFLRLGSFNIIMWDCIPYELWRSNWSHDNLRQVVLRSQRIVVASCWVELHTFGRGPLNVCVCEVVLRLVKTDVQSSGRWSINVPVLIRVLRSVVKLSRAKLSGLRTYF